MKKLIIIFIITLVCICPIINAEASPNDKAQEILDNMSLNDKICQTLMVHAHKWNGKDSCEVTEDMAKVFQDYHFGGVVLFGQNTPDTKSTLNYVKDLQINTTKTGGLPLIFTLDQEGGAVFRIYSGTSLLGNMATGATNNPQIAANSGSIASHELNALGINSTLAPCVDTNTNAGNPIIGLRSFGDNKYSVGELGTSFMKTYNGLAFVKHFPGHGDVASDTHTGQVINYKSEEELKNTDIVPFKTCIDNGCEAIMTAHITFPNIDNTELDADKVEGKITTPATLSKKIMTNILRGELNFQGLVCTDAITMQGVSNYFTEPTAIKYALEAGNDMVAEAINAENAADYKAHADNIIDKLSKWAETDNNMEILNKAVKRVIQTKINKGIINYNPNNYTVDKANKVLRNPEFLATEYKDTAESTTLVKNENNTIPIKLNENSKVLFLTQNSTSATNKDRNSKGSYAIAWNRLKALKLIPNNLEPTIIQFDENADIKSLNIENSDYVIVDSAVNANNLMGYLSWQTKIPNDIVNYAHSLNKKTVVLSVRLPYDCQLYPNADAILCTYNYVSTVPDYKQVLKDNITSTDLVSGPNLIEGVEAIFGNINIHGKLPVNVPEFNYDKDNPGYKSNIIYNRDYGINTEQVIHIDNLDIKLNDKNVSISSGNKEINYGNFSVPISRTKKTYEEGKDYTLNYTDSSITIEGKNNIIGSKTIYFGSKSASTSDYTFTIIIIALIMIGFTFKYEIQH